MPKKKILKRIIALTGAVIITSTMAFSTGIAHAEAERLNMSYIYFGDSSQYTEHVENTQSSLNIISPNYFNLDEDGNLVVTDAVDEDFIDEMEDQDVKVIPFLSNHWDREVGRAALENMEDLVDDLCKMVKKYDLDGVNLDLENLTDADRDDYTEFVKLLREELPSRKELSVAVAPNPFNIQTGWQGSYDYKKLAKYSDYLVIMAYDESYPGGPAGPVASVSFVEESIKNMLEDVPNEKIMMGIPFFGRIWDESGELKGYGMSIKKINALVNEYDGEIVFDKDKKTPRATVEITDNNGVYLFGGKLQPGKYTIWYENDESIKSKLRLVQKYDLKGTASWSLGQEYKEVWNYYKLWLNGEYFEDIENHWASEAILNMDNKGWMKGTSTSAFSPDEPLTRAQGAAILVRALDLEEKKSSKSDFDDVSRDYWAKEEIDIASQYDIIKGYEDGSFKPEKPITREEMAVMLDRVLSESLKNRNSKLEYEDIEDDRWSYEEISKMTYNDIFKGFEDNTFRPTKGVTRGQMAALMDRISSYIEEK